MAESVEAQAEHGWPGKAGAVVLAAQPDIPLMAPPDYLRQAGGIHIRRRATGSLPPEPSLFHIGAGPERRKIIETLEALSLSQTEAAEALRIPLSILNRKIKPPEIPLRKRKSEVRAQKPEQAARGKCPRAQPPATGGLQSC